MSCKSCIVQVGVDIVFNKKTPLSRAAEYYYPAPPLKRVFEKEFLDGTAHNITVT